MYGTDINNKGKKEKNRKIKEGPCIFPFMYKWKSHDKCYKTDKGDICATEISLPRRTLKKRGYCIKKSTKKKTLKRKIDKSKVKKKGTLVLKKRKKKKSTMKIRKLKKRLRLPSKIEKSKSINKSIKHKSTDMPSMNAQFVKVLEQLESLMMKKGQHFRARAYTKAKESIILLKTPITEVSQLKGQKGIGKTILTKLQEFVDTGTLNVLEKAKSNPMFIFTEVYGIGPKKAEELVKKHNVTTIVELRERQDELLNDVQKKGLKYYEDILKRIPRKEIDTYEKELKKIFDTVKNKDSTFQIMGSYRRGAKDSGDIDICISDPKDDTGVFIKFIDALIEKNILIEVLSRGNTKSLGVSKLRRKPARRIDFMFTKHKELAFALLYFTGSKEFNTVMRKRALDMGYSMNEHGLYKMVNGKKGEKLDRYFPTEESVFKFMGMVYKGPTERKDGNAVVLIEDAAPLKTFWQETYPGQNKKISKKIDKSKTKKKTLKKLNSGAEIRKGKRFIKEFLKVGQSQLEELDESGLSSMIRAANKGYYCNNKSLMSDEEYDILKEFIEEKFPDNVAIQEGHTMCSVKVEKKKMTLPFEMWSMDKFKKEQQITTWLKDYKGPFIISAKVDGVSAGYSTMGDKPILFTRGNGKVGQDISHAIEYLGLPTQKGIEIRGELLMKKDVFETNWSDRFANVRNMIAGTANAKESFPERWNDIDFVCYEVVTPHLTPSKQFALIKNLNIISVIHKKMTKIDKTVLSKYLIDWRENYDYDIDGIIVADNKKYPRTSKNPKHAFAFKTVLDDQIVESKVVDVIWSPSKDGYLKPKVQIQPVKLGGAVIQYATLHNAEFVIKNKIGLGAVVQILRSGDVIPKVEKVVKPAKTIKMPSSNYKYEWNSTKKDLVLIDAGNNDIVKLKIMDDFFNKMDVVGLGRGNIQRIMNAGYKTIPKILTMTIQDFMSVEGFKEKMSTKIYNSIHERLDNVTLPSLMGASNIFGRGLGTKRIIAIMDEYPNILTSSESQEEKLEKISQLDGFKDKTARLFVPYIPKFIKFLKDIKQTNKLSQVTVKNVDKSHPLYNKKIVITGFRDKELQQKLDKIGVKLGTSVSKKTFVVLVNDIDDDTGKADKARALEVQLMTPEMFKKKYSI
jgi:DNA ligase (NAD+)